MIRPLIHHAFASFAAALLLSGTALAADAPPPGSAAAIVKTLKGNVVWQQTGQPVPRGLSQGDQVFNGDEVSTESKSHVTLSFGNDAAVILGEKGVLSVTGATRVKIANAPFVLTGKAPQIESDCGLVTLQTGRLAQAEKDGACAFYLHEGTATIKNTAGLTVLTAGQGTLIQGQGAASTPATWTEADVKSLRAGLPQGAVPSLVVAPPQPKKPVEQAPAAQAPVEQAPVTPAPAEQMPAAPTPAEQTSESPVETSAPIAETAPPAATGNGAAIMPETLPAESVKEETPIEEAVPEETLPEETVPEEIVTEELAPTGTLPAPESSGTLHDDPFGVEELPDATAPY